jgi:hypothetical protein
MPALAGSEKASKEKHLKSVSLPAPGGAGRAAPGRIRENRCLHGAPICSRGTVEEPIDNS